MLLERLLDNLAVEVEAFATCRVASGWRLRLPALDWVTFHFVVRGRGEVRGEVPEGRDLSSGSLAVVPPHLVHGLQCGPSPHAEAAVGGGGHRGDIPEHGAGPEGETDLLVVCGRVEVLFGAGIGVFDHLDDVLVLEFAREPGMGPIFEALLGEVLEPRPGSRAMVSALMSQSLVHVFRRLCDEPECGMPWLGALEDPDLEKALKAMLESPGDPHTVASLARLCYMSRSTFARRFRDGFGRPPMEYLRAIRLRNAARLLRREPHLPVAAVARRVGFGSRSQFSRAFKELFDESPSGFRA